MRFRRPPLLVLPSVLCLAASAPLPRACAKPAPSATVSAVSGTPWLRRSSERGAVRLQLRQPLYIGDLIRADERSGATVLFRDGAQARLKPNSVIQITNPNTKINGHRSLFRVITGEVWGHLRPGNAVETRTAALGVLGTQIVLQVAGDGSTTLTVTDGKVEFFNQFGKVVVQEKQQSTARPGAAPTKPITLENPGMIVEWRFTLDRAMIPREKFFSTPDRQLASARLPGLEAAARQASLQGEAASQVLARQSYGDALFDSGRYAEARAQYEAAAQQAEPSEQPGLKIRLGYALMEEGNLEAAEAAMKAALPQPRGSTTHLVGLGSDLASDDQYDPEAEDDTPQAAPALVALADLKLERNQPAQAQEMALRAARAAGAAPSLRQASAVGEQEDDTPASTWGSSWGEAHLTLGLALLRQGSRAHEAATSLRAVLKSQPQSLHYQARAWLSLALLAQNETAQALDEARQSVKLQPRSGLAHGNLALVAFYAGELREAQKEAELALELNPESVAARVALGQALLAQGKVDRANKIAAQAVALDGSLPQARYLLGISEASRRDYRHAERELRQAVDLAPSDIRSRAALARVLTAMGRRAQAVAVLREALPSRWQAPAAGSASTSSVANGALPYEALAQADEADGVLAALGDVLYEQRRYTESAEQYRRAIRQNSQSALYQAGLARSLVFSNRLEEAVKAGQAAVTLAPSVGQYHALLGVAYQFSQMPAQAEREFRDALLLDPQNALALTQLAYRYEGSDQRPAAVGFSQGFLLNPSIGSQLLRGGVHAELSPSAGDRGSGGLSLGHRSMAAQGRVNSFGYLSNSDAPGFRPNEGRRRIDISEHLTLQPNSKTNLYFNGRFQRDRGGLPGSLSAPDGNDRSGFGYGQVQVASRTRLGASSQLWLGLFGNASRNTTLDPGLDSFFDEATGLAVSSQRFTSRALVPELRFDRNLSRDSSRTSLLSFGAAFLQTGFRSARSLERPGLLRGSATGMGSGLFSQDDRSLMLYSQLTHQVGTRLSLSAQMRLQTRSRSSSWLYETLGSDPRESSQKGSGSYVLPNFVASYQVSPSTSLRVQHSDRLTDATSSALAPSETLLTTERSALPTGIAERTRLSQVELQRRTSRRSFLKLFAFQTRASNVQSGFSDLLGFGNGLPSPQAPGLNVDRWSGRGAGAVYEHQLGQHLFLSTGATVRSTNAQSFGLQAPFSGQQAPYEPKYLGRLSLNYIDKKGNKAGLAVRRTGSFFQDTPLALGRPSFGAATYVDLLLAKERTVGTELYFSVTNLFDRREVSFNGFPRGQRRINFGFTRRF